MIRSFLVCLLCMLTSAVLAQSEVHTFELENGLRLLVKEDHRAPVVVSQLWYKVGASYEHRGISGVSHALEHMMFKGTQKIEPGRFSKIIAEQGGRENAFTGADYTAYFQRVQKDRLAICLQLEADRMHNLLLDKEEFKREIEVIKEERRLRTEDDPQSVTYEQFEMAAYMTSPYRIPIIGWMKDLDQMQVDDLRRWYLRWYAPNNATLVIVGDVEPEQVLTLAKKAFGALPRVGIRVPKLLPEIPQQGVKRIVVKEPAKLPYIVLGYKTPSLATAVDPKEAYALEVLSGILDGGDSARLTRELIRGQQLATSTSAGYDLYARLDTLFMLSGTPTVGTAIHALEQGLLDAVQQVRQVPISEAELARVKSQVVAQAVYQLDSVFYQGMRIGMLETVGIGWQAMDQYVDSVRAVTAAQVQAVALKYLQEDHLTIAVLEPQTSFPQATKPVTKPVTKGAKHAQ